MKNQKIIIYEDKIMELRQIFLNSGLDKDKWGKYAVEIILVAAMVNMHIPKIELKKLLKKMKINKNYDSDNFKIALLNLKENEILWQCDNCKGSDCRAKREKMNDFCLRDIDTLLDNLEKCGYKFGEQKKKLLNGLEIISSHGIKSCGEIKEVWKLEKDGIMWATEIDREFNNQFTVEHFDNLIDSKLQNKTISMLESANEEIKIISTYGQWVAKEEFKWIIEEKIKKV